MGISVLYADPSQEHNAIGFLLEICRRAGFSTSLAVESHHHRRDYK
jgi:hypothetical protein